MILTGIFEMIRMPQRISKKLGFRPVKTVILKGRAVFGVYEKCVVETHEITSIPDADTVYFISHRRSSVEKN